jgi:hypothetical protein
MNDKDIERFFTKVEQGENENDCWKWHGTKLNGTYGHFKLNKKMILAHRLSYEYHNNCQIKEGNIILHSCDNPECTNPNHLKEGTQLENIIDRQNKNRQNKGEQQRSAKLTEQQVKEIRLKYSYKNITHSKLANEYQVATSTITQVLNYYNWKDI